MNIFICVPGVLPNFNVLFLYNIYDIYLYNIFEFVLCVKFNYIVLYFYFINDER